MPKRHRKVNHHLVPLSVGGTNWTENVVTITVAEHERLHRVLDIPYKMIRSYRKRTNHLLFTPNLYVHEQLVRLQLAYFARLPLLEEKLIALHDKTMREVYERACTEYSVMIQKRPLGNFKHYLDLYHDVLKTVLVRGENNFIIH